MCVVWVWCCGGDQERSLHVVYSSRKEACDDYRVHVHAPKTFQANKKPEPTLSYWCFKPGVAIRVSCWGMKTTAVQLASRTCSYFVLGMATCPSYWLAGQHAP